MKQTICPNCGGSLESLAIGWRCKKCKGFISYQDGKFYEYVEKPFLPPMTKADRIRAMSDEELAKFICEWCNCVPGYCPGLDLCTPSMGNANGLVKWLKQPVEVHKEE